MSTDVVAEVKSQSLDELAEIVRQILGEDATPVGEMITTKIGRSAGSGTAGIFHVAGRAKTQTGETNWSAVVKALGKPENLPSGTESDAYVEVDVYRSLAFADVCGGVRAAHCYGIQPRDEHLLLWLEDLSIRHSRLGALTCSSLQPGISVDSTHTGPRRRCRSGIGSPWMVFEPSLPAAHSSETCSNVCAQITIMNWCVDLCP